MNRLRFLSVITIVATFVASTLYADVASIPLAELIRMSELIVVAQVIAIHPAGANRAEERYAHAKVLEVWKGSPLVRKVEFAAYPTWACDVSDAAIGEKAVLFLVRDPKEKAYKLAHAGAGRMPLVTVDGVRIARLLGAVIPDGMQDPPVTGKGWEHGRRLYADELKRVVQYVAAK